MYTVYETAQTADSSTELIKFPCGKPAVDCLDDQGSTTRWFCAEHYDYVMWAKASAKRAAQEFGLKHGK